MTVAGATPRFVGFPASNGHDPQRVAAQLGDQVEAVELGRGLDIAAQPDSLHILSATSQAQQPRKEDDSQIPFHFEPLAHHDEGLVVAQERCDFGYSA